jgi:GTP cyclohydrolase I
MSSKASEFRGELDPDLVGIESVLPHPDVVANGGRDPLEKLARALLVEIGEDPERDGLRGTPERFARWWREFVNYDAGKLETTFEAVTSDQLIEVKGIRVWSLCEHHLLPFWCDISIAYLAHQRIVGLSKFARIAQAHAHRLQVQERLTANVADSVCALAESPDVAVFASGEHLCMTIRGIKAEATMSTSVLRGAFHTDPAMRNRLTIR